MIGRDEPTLDVRNIQGGTVFGPDPSTLPPAVPAPEAAELPVVDIHHYKIIGEHARGGMGRVLIARDERLGRLVAIKKLLSNEKEQLRLWDVASGAGRVLRSMPTVGAMAFSPSGKMLAISEHRDRQVHLWDGDKLQSYLEREPVSRLAFVDDDLLVVGGANGGVWLRGPRGGAVPLLGHATPVVALRVFPRGGAATVASLAEDGTLRMWTDPVPTEPGALRAWLDGMTNLEVGEDDRVGGR